MKNYLIIILMTGLFVGIVNLPVYSQSPTETISGTVDAEVQDLKDKVAEKVEELKGKNKKAVSGIVQEVGDNSIVILNGEKNKVEIDVDDTLTSFYDIVGTKIKEGTFGDIKKGTYIFVTGPAIGETVTANEIYTDTQYLVMSGKIVEVDADAFTVKIVTIDKSDYTLDIEKTTKQNLLDIKTFETNSIGFSKLKEGDSVHVVVKGDPENPDSDRFTAVKLLIIPNEYFLQ